MKAFHSTARIRLALMIGILTFVLASCKKSPETIGNNLISDNDYIGIYHTENVVIYSHSYLDSIGTKNVSNGLLGSMNDPIFGLSQAGFSTQFHLSTEGQSFGDNPVMDSLVLQLCLSGYYGDTTTMQTAHAYVLSDTLSADETYYNHSEVAYDPIDIANGFQFYPHPKTTTNVVGSDTINSAIIRIPLSAELGNYLMNLDPQAYSKPDLFKELFKGLRLQCSPVSGDGSICYINLTTNTITQLQLYYHDQGTPENPMKYNFYVTSADTYFNQVTHDYSTGDPDLVSQVLEGDTTSGQQKIYLQTMGGVRAKIVFPEIPHWQDTCEGHIVINDAKLIIPAADMDSSVYTKPNTMVLVGLNADGTTSLLPDYLEGSNYFGGTYNASTNCITFRISEYLQDLLLNKTDNLGISLGINGAGYNAQRIVVNGPDAPQDKMRLSITYSIVNE